MREGAGEVGKEAEENVEEARGHGRVQLLLLRVLQGCEWGEGIASGRSGNSSGEFECHYFQEQ